jgi:hypothetical protein
VADAVSAARPLSEEGLYWNATCLDAIGAPTFWHKERLQPVIDAWRASLPQAALLSTPVPKRP